MTVNIADTLAEVAARQQERPGLIEARTGKVLTFGELNRTADRYASFLHQNGIAAGDRVMLMVKPSADFICLTFALFRIGAPVILIDPGMGYKNLLTCIKGVRPDFLIGIPQAILLRKLFRGPFSSVRKTFCCGSNWLGLTGADIREQAAREQPVKTVFSPDDTALAAIIFTTGSTGPPKGVRFEHTIFAAQLQLIKDYYGIGPEDIDQPGFPLFALFSTALGACAVIPDMDPTCPARLDPQKFLASIEKYRVTYSFGSPAIWNAVSRYAVESKKKCPSLKKVLMAGAPVPGNLIKRVYKLLPPDGQIFVPYGATESLPIVSIEGREIVEQTWNRTRSGKGTCVGRPLPGIEVKVIGISEQQITSLSECREEPPGTIGEIIVTGPVVTKAYENNESENARSKIGDGTRFWHRLGDVGYFDAVGRLWFCGRKAHRVKSAAGTMYTIPCEAVINEHPDVFRSALVGIPAGPGVEVPVIIVEMEKNSSRKKEELLAEVQQIAEQNPLTEKVHHFLLHPSFPVDIRHNAKIFREQLSVWAAREIGK